MTPGEEATVTDESAEENEAVEAIDWTGVNTFTGYGQAASYLGLKRNTLSSYVARGIGPKQTSVQADGQYNLPVFTREQLDHWKANRPGQGARTDLVKAGI